jgi:glyoxylase-like metal-dependent hydrolase (beta-lactamase superfamily II)
MPLNIRTATIIYLAAALPGACFAQPVAAQDAKSVIESAIKTMGAGNLGSIRYSGSGSNFALGQAPNPSSPWPRFNVKKYERVIDFDAGATRQTMVRTQAENPPRGGGQQPLIGEQTQMQTNGFQEPWAAQFEVWVTPDGFLKGALAHNATVQARTVGGAKYNVVSFSADSKHKVTGYVDDHNLVAKVETLVENPVLGDMPVEATFSDYKDFHGLKFPTKIVEKQGGYPVLDLTVDDANRNVVAGVQAPLIDTSAVPAFGVDEQLIADDVYYFTGGTHHSVIVNFKDYVVVIEAPLDEARSNAVIGEVKKLYYNKPIRYVINTHAHFDHAGGLRTYAAEGATILTYQLNKPYYEKTFALPRTLSPDKLLQSKKKAVIESVGEKKVLTDGSHTIELYHVPSGHNDGMLIAYLPQDKVLIEADLYTPPATGAAAPADAPVNPYTLGLVENLDKLKLDYNKILPLHGRIATKDELMKAVGKPVANPTTK